MWRWIRITYDLSLLDTPDLVFALPLAPEGHGGARGGISALGEIDVEAGVADENAEGEGPLASDRL